MAKTCVPAIKLNLTQSNLRAIGHVIAQWAFLETEMDFTIRSLQVVTEHKGARKGLPRNLGRRMRLWRDLTKKAITNHAIRDEARDIIKRTKIASGHRNAFTHARLSRERVGNRVAIRVETHRHLDAWGIEETRITEQSLEKVACTISEISRDLRKFNHAYLRISPQSLPYKFPR